MDNGTVLSPEQAMTLALESARAGLGFVSPNPVVGCVIVDREHRLLSQGAHLRYGGPHAEIDALQKIKDLGELAGATIYVTLEPCAHQGKTGSCARYLAQLPIAKVVYGTLDPNPLVAGQGLEILRAARIAVELSSLEVECRQLAEQFLYHMVNGKPFIALKVASSLDGKMALNDGRSQWITGEESRCYARQLRAHYDATLIGTGTLKHDNPRLDFRETVFANKKQNRVVLLDGNGSAVESFKEKNIYKIHGPKNIFVLTREEHREAWAQHLVHVIPWESSLNGWERALQNLYQKGVSSLFVEGGAYVFGQMLQYRQTQKLYLFQSSKVIGAGLSWSHYFESQDLKSVPILKKGHTQSFGEDCLHTLYF